MRKTLIAGLVAQFIASATVWPLAVAQTSGSTGVSGYGYATPSIAPAPTTIAYPTYPVQPVESGFLQFNNLRIESVSGTSMPAEILATNPNIYTIMGDSSAGGGMSTPPAPSSVGSCLKFDSPNSATGKALPCPTPPTTTTPPTIQSSPIPSSGNSASPMIYPAPPFAYRPYRIKVDASTRLLLRDRTSATLGSFSSGDEINVFGYYNNDGSIQAYLIRDLSKPVQNEFLQLNNMQLVSVSENELVVTQSGGYPCYGFGVDGSMRKEIACPMGIMSPAGNPALQNLSVPEALMPNWMMLRKYVIKFDSGTIFLDTNRTRVSISDLRVGDQLNIYGDTSDGGQTLAADIIRDLSIPATPSTYNGKVTQVNADGSFIIQTDDGRIITVQNPIQVGAAIQLTGLLDRLKSVLTQVSNIYIGGTGTISYPPQATPGMLRIQGSGTFPVGSGGVPDPRN